jgi:hypothetical protein
MAIINTTLLLFVFLALVSVKYRISQNYSTPNVIKQMLVLPNSTLAIGFSYVIQIIDATDYQTVKQEIETKDDTQINGAVVFLQSGTINSVAKKP